MVFARHQVAAHLESKRELIDHCFSASTVEEVCERLRATNEEWATTTLKELARMSPTALKVRSSCVRAVPLDALHELERLSYLHALCR